MIEGGLEAGTNEDVPMSSASLTLNMSIHWITTIALLVSRLQCVLVVLQGIFELVFGLLMSLMAIFKGVVSGCFGITQHAGCCCRRGYAALLMGIQHGDASLSEPLGDTPSETPYRPVQQFPQKCKCCVLDGHGRMLKDVAWRTSATSLIRTLLLLVVPGYATPLLRARVHSGDIFTEKHQSSSYTIATGSRTRSLQDAASSMEAAGNEDFGDVGPSVPAGCPPSLVWSGQLQMDVRRRLLSGYSLSAAAISIHRQRICGAAARLLVSIVITGACAAAVLHSPYSVYASPWASRPYPPRCARQGYPPRALDPWCGHFARDGAPTTGTGLLVDVRPMCCTMATTPGHEYSAAWCCCGPSWPQRSNPLRSLRRGRLYGGLNTGSGLLPVGCASHRGWRQQSSDEPLCTLYQSQSASERHSPWNPRLSAPTHHWSPCPRMESTAFDRLFLSLTTDIRSFGIVASDIDDWITNSYSVAGGTAALYSAPCADWYPFFERPPDAPRHVLPASSDGIPTRPRDRGNDGRSLPTLLGYIAIYAAGSCAYIYVVKRVLPHAARYRCAVETFIDFLTERCVPYSAFVYRLTVPSATIPRDIAPPRRESVTAPNGVTPVLVISPGYPSFRLEASMRAVWLSAQEIDKSLWPIVHEERLREGFRFANDGLLEHLVLPADVSNSTWVPVVPNGRARGKWRNHLCLPWRVWLFHQFRAGIAGENRSAKETLALLAHWVWWPNMDRDISRWHDAHPIHSQLRSSCVGGASVGFVVPRSVLSLRREGRWLRHAIRAWRERMRVREGRDVDSHAQRCASSNLRPGPRRTFQQEWVKAFLDLPNNQSRRVWIKRGTDIRQSLLDHDIPSDWSLSYDGLEILAGGCTVLTCDRVVSLMVPRGSDISDEWALRYEGIYLPANVSLLQIGSCFVQEIALHLRPRRTRRDRRPHRPGVVTAAAGSLVGVQAAQGEEDPGSRSSFIVVVVLAVVVCAVTAAVITTFLCSGRRKPRYEAPEVLARTRGPRERARAAGYPLLPISERIAESEVSSGETSSASGSDDYIRERITIYPVDPAMRRRRPPTEFPEPEPEIDAIAGRSRCPCADCCNGVPPRGHSNTPADAYVTGLHADFLARTR